jgi:hypothetical protein
VQPVSTGVRVVATLAVTQQKSEFVNIYSGLLKDFKSTLKIKECKKKFNIQCCMS